MKQLFELSRKFPKEWIKKAPKGKFGNYVPHPVITQRLLEVCGPFNWEVVELIRQESSGSVVGCFGKLTVDVDGKPVTVTSIGDVEHDQKNDGSNAKHAESDGWGRYGLQDCTSKIRPRKNTSLYEINRCRPKITRFNV